MTNKDIQTTDKESEEILCPECEHPIPDYELSSKCPTCTGGPNG